jgi:diaminopimelate epimerase
MSGSGNDFVFVDARSEPPGRLDQPGTIRAICARGTGVGADGIVFLEPTPTASVSMRYLNSDGSVASLCGNATLCAARLFVELGGAAIEQAFSIQSGSGVLAAVVRPGGHPTVEMPVVEELTVETGTPLYPGERRAAFAKVGIPHLVILCDDIGAVDVVARGRPLRFDPVRPDGTNVDFVSQGPDGRWYMRTYERGVEGETLACGTGAVAAAVALDRWGLAAPVATGAGGARGGTGHSIVTRSGNELRIDVTAEGDQVRTTLTGEARIVYHGFLGEI